VGAARGNFVFINPLGLAHSKRLLRVRDPARQKLAPHRQLFEEMILVLDGRGSTTVWNDAGHRITFEWKAGALFAIPLNAWHQALQRLRQGAGALRLGDQRPAGDQPL